MSPRRWAEFPSAPGTYVLILEASVRRRVRIGALGGLELEPGFYAYVGSARGPGGLAARLAHHGRRAPRPHWHIDYVRPHVVLHEVWLARGRTALEHRWASVLGSMRSASVPLERFGASDCACESHFFRFEARPRLGVFRRRLGSERGTLRVLVAPAWRNPPRG